MIITKEAFSTSSLKDDIESLSLKETPLESQKLANIVSKYVLCLLGESPNKRITYEELNERMWEIKRVLKSRERNESDSVIKSLKYQLEMILDFPATIEVMRDIIENIETSKVTWNKWFHGLDLWSGSGILMVAQYIWAKRSWIQEPTISWIEFESNAQLFSNSLIWKLGIGTVKKWDVRESSSYDTKEPSAVTIELLSTSGAPFLHFHLPHMWWGEDYEPFLESLLQLRQAYGVDSFSRFQMFPRWLEHGTIYSGKLQAGIAKDMYNLGHLPEHDPKRVSAAAYYPTRILIWNTWKRLDEIGSLAMPEIFKNTRNFRRWSHMSPQLLESIYRNQRSKLETSIPEEVD